MKPIDKKGDLTRRRFLKYSATATAAASIAGNTSVLEALVPTATAAENPAIAGLEKKYSVCDMCFNKCGLIARVDKGVVVKLDPNPKMLSSRGLLCARGNAGIQRLYDPDRLQTPLLRKGDRGGGQWQRISWNQALDLAAHKLQEIGKQYTRCGTLFMAGSDMQTKFVHQFAEAYGSYNIISHESNCLLSRNRAYLDTFGVMPMADLLHARYVLMPGANCFEALVMPDSVDLMTAIRRDCKLVVLDPRQTKTAALAHEWYAIKPGTDMAFFLAVMHVLITEKRYDADFVKHQTHGFEQLKRHVQKYTPRWAEKECDIPAADIARISRELAAAAPAAIVYPGRRTSDYTDSTQIRRANAILNALLGNWDKPGGLVLPQSIHLGTIPFEAPFYEDNPDDRIDMGRSTMMFDTEGAFKHARDAVIEGKPYPVKGFLTYKTNPMQTGANRRKTIQMINKLDFMLSIDVTMSDTAWMADLVLPAATYLERMDPVSVQQGVSSGPCLVTRDPMVKPLYESKSALWIMQQLANRLNLGKHFDFTMEQYRAAQLKELPEAVSALQKDGVYQVGGVYTGLHKGFKTLSKKVELYNQRYADAGIDPMPVYRPPKLVPENRFRMVVGRNAYITQGSTTNNKLLHELVPENDLWIHPDAARKLGIGQGDRVVVSSAVGKQKIKAFVTKKTRRDTVYMHSGFGVLSRGLKTVYGKGACIVEVLEDKNDDISGNMAMHETIVTIQKV
ncbi:molybdopterin-dependent oxidoreductase [bacterium]|nr:molybdopterin-dependent oxidoreductase [bacterium]